jgi:predicted Ser/Thr protein kinase
LTDLAYTRVRLALIAILVLSATVLVLQLAVVRPFLWPAGAGVALTGDSILVPFAIPSPLPRVRPPDASRAADVGVVAAVREGGEAALAGLAPGVRVTAVSGPGPGPDMRQVTGVSGPGADMRQAELLRVWRDAYWLGTRGAITVTVDRAGSSDEIALDRPPFWSLDNATRAAWLRVHAGALLQTAAFLAGAIVLVALGTRGMTATLMTLALIVTAVANAGSLVGAERAVPFATTAIVLFGWLATPLAFPIIGLAVLYFPTRAEVLDRHRWIIPALGLAAAPMFVISLLAALFLIGMDAVSPPLAWLSTRAWAFDASFAVALAANVLIVIEGIGRYRQNLDVNERRRIQIVVFTGVPAVFAYAIRAGVPLLSSLAGRPLELHWVAESVLQAIVLLPAFGLPYAVAVRHVFSPRTVLRRSLQYALARRTLSVLIVLPIAAFLITLIAERDRPLGDIVLGQPMFFVVCLVLAAAGMRYRDPAQRWLDRRFFRDEYDAREILMSLASRVPYETDPRELVAMVLTQIDSALHPESAAVLAGDGDRLDVVSELRSHASMLPRENAIVTLLRWSDEPLEVFLDDERSPAARLPQTDRRWLADSGAQLLVPIFTRAEETHTIVGIILLGQKRSEEPYTAEDRRLLNGIAAQMSVALDLSRLRRSAPQSTDRAAATTPALTPTMVMGTAAATVGGLAMCPICLRCFDAASGPTRCPDDGQTLQAVLGMPPVVDGKYRVDAVIGRGGMGAVFRALDLRLDRDVAIKIVRADLVADPESRARFRREAQIVARLQHPAIVTVFDYGNLADGAAFLVMEYVRGEDLRHVLKRERMLSLSRTVDLMFGISLGVEAAHRAGVLHRDLKPENILLPANGTGPKVLDFGVAKITEAGAGDGSTLTTGATIVGTPAYMAPEQLRGEKLDARADVYSLAAVTYEALTGELPFGTGSFIDIGIRQAGGAKAIDTAKLPQSVAAVLVKALSLDRDLRPPSPVAFARELEHR